MMKVERSFNSRIGHCSRPAAGFLAVNCLGFFCGLLVPASVSANEFKAIIVAPSVYRQAFNSVHQRYEDDALLSPGTRLGPEDRLKRKGRGMATILCQNGVQTFKAPNYIQVSSFCQSQRAAPVQAMPGSQDPSLPYLLEPRLGLVRSPTPTVRWNPVAGVRRYQVRLLRQGDPIPLWNSAWIDASRITLPAQLSLLPGESYQLVVEAENSTSSRLEPSNADLRFGVLPPDEVQQLELDLAEIRSLPRPDVPPQTVVLLEVGALEQRGLVAEAFALLNQRERQNPSLEGLLQLGRLASLQGLNHQAQRYFRQAAEVARQAGNAEGLVEAQKGEQRAIRLVAAALPASGDRSLNAVPTTPAAP